MPIKPVYNTNLSFKNNIKAKVKNAPLAAFNENNDMLFSTLDNIANVNKMSIQNTGKNINIVQNKLQNGDIVELEYQNGILTKSTRKGIVNVIKEFHYENGNPKPIRITKKDFNGAILDITILEYDANKNLTRLRNNTSDVNIVYDSDSKPIEITKVLGAKRIYNTNGYLESEILPNGIAKVLIDKEQVVYQKFPNELEEFYDTQGQLRYRRFSDGRYEGYHYNGQKKLEKSSDNTIKKWNESGELIYEKLNDETEIIWNRDEGRKYICKKFQGGVQTKCYHNGILEYEKLQNGTKKYYSKDGKLKEEIFADNTKITYYPDGQVRNKIFSNGQAECYYNNKQLMLEMSADGSRKQWDRNGNLIYKI